MSRLVDHRGGFWPVAVTGRNTGPAGGRSFLMVWSWIPLPVLGESEKPDPGGAPVMVGPGSFLIVGLTFGGAVHSVANVGL